MFAALKKSIWPDPPAWREPETRPVGAMVSGRVFPAAKASRPVTPDGTEARQALAENANMRASVVAEIAKIEAKTREIADAGRVDDKVAPEDALSPEAMAKALADPLSFDVSAAKTNLTDRLADAAHARLVGQPIIVELARKARSLAAEHGRLLAEARHLTDAVIVAEGAQLMNEARQASEAALDRLAAIDGLISSARASGNGTLVSNLMAQRRAYPDERDTRRDRSAGIMARFRRWASIRLPNDPHAVEEVSP